MTTFVVLSTALFVGLYMPAVSRFSRGLASPYAKADVRRRFAAAGVDGSIALTCLGAYAAWPSPWLIVMAAAYLLLRDAVGGQSPGKFLFSVMVVRLDNGKPANVGASAARNAMLLLPGANIAAAALEAFTIARDPLGHRLGDRIARTQVVDGLGAKELVSLFQQQLLASAVGGAREGRSPVEVGRFGR